MMPIFKKWININDRDMSTRSKGYIVKRTGSRATESRKNVAELQSQENREQGGRIKKKIGSRATVSRKQKMDYRDSKTEAVLEEE